MKFYIFLGFILCIGFELKAQEDFRVKANDAIEQLISDYNTARENKDEPLLRSLFLIDVDQLVSSGEWRKGIEDAVEGMKKSSSNNPGTRKLSIENIRYLNQQNAIVDTKYDIIGENGVERNMWSTFVVVMTTEGWKIAAIRNMLPSQ